MYVPILLLGNYADYRWYDRACMLCLANELVAYFGTNLVFPENAMKISIIFMPQLLSFTPANMCTTCKMQFVSDELDVAWTATKQNRSTIGRPTQRQFERKHLKYKMNNNNWWTIGIHVSHRLMGFSLGPISLLFLFSPFVTIYSLCASAKECRVSIDCKAFVVFISRLPIHSVASRRLPMRYKSLRAAKRRT